MRVSLLLLSMLEKVNWLFTLYRPPVMASLRKVMSQEIWYKLDPTFGTYTMNLTGAEPSLEEEPIGVYGMKWMNFMQEQHPDLVDVMQFHGNYLTVARSVDRSARKYRELLDSHHLVHREESFLIAYFHPRFGEIDNQDFIEEALAGFLDQHQIF